MKKLLVTLAVAITGAVQAFALTPTAIRENARFLTDRMAYELNLTPQQIEDCYEINYDFIASINPIMDEVVYGYPEYIDRYYNFGITFEQLMGEYNSRGGNSRVDTDNDIQNDVQTQ